MSGDSNEKRSYFFLQSLTISGKRIERAIVKTVSYMEHANMNGSLLLLEIKDEHGKIKDEIKIKHGDLIVASLGDPDDSGALFQEQFTVIKSPYEGGLLKVVALQKNVSDMKVPAVSPKFFVDKPTLSTIRGLAGGVPVNAGRVTGLCTYHLDVGETPSGLIREVARDHACLCYWSRGKLHLMPYSEAFSQPPVLTLEHDNPRAKNQIAYLKWLDHEFTSEVSSNKRYSSYSMTEGWLISAGSDGVPIEFVPNATQSQLNNRVKRVIPLMEIEAAGFGEYRAGVMVGLRINTTDADSVLDESAPANALITRVTHYETGTNYTCVMTLGVLRG